MYVVLIVALKSVLRICSKQTKRMIYIRIICSEDNPVIFEINCISIPYFSCSEQ